MYFRLAIKGSMGTYENWSINPVFDPQGEVENTWDQPTGQAMVNAASTVALPTALKSALAGFASVNHWRLEGRHSTTDELLGWAEKIGPAQFGTGATNVQTAQTAIVVSLRTNTPGARGRGRLYWPAFGASVNDSWRWSAPTPTAFTNDMKTYLKGLETAMLAAVNPIFPWTSLNLAVRSKANAATPHVVQLQAGDILDTQRRRRDRLPENYVSTVYP